MGGGVRVGERIHQQSIDDSINGNIDYANQEVNDVI